MDILCQWSLDGTFTLEEYKVIGDPLEKTSTYSCGQFSRIRILCAHALKVLNLMNIKSLPTQYVLKRWTREARSGTIQDSHDRDIIENSRLDEMLRYKNMTRKFLNLAHRAASHPGCTLLVHNTLDILSKQVEEEITGCTNNVEAVTVPMNITPSSDLVERHRKLQNWHKKLQKYMIFLLALHGPMKGCLNHT